MDSAIKPEIEIMLKEVRTQKGLTQKYIAEKMGFSTQRYNDIEKGRKLPSILLALRLAEVMGCDVNDIYRLRIKQ